MTAAFVYFATRSARNHLVRRLKDLRYLVGLAVAAAYVAVLIGTQHRHTLGNSDVASSIATSALVLICMVWWWSLSTRRALSLSPAQVHWLVPAPIPPRGLLVFKLLAAQPPLAANAILVGLLLRTDSTLLTGLRICAVYFVLVAMHLQRAVVAVARMRSSGGVLMHPVALRVCRGVVLVAVCAVAWRWGSGIVASMSGGAMASHLATAVWKRSWVGIALLPFDAVMAPLFAHSPIEWSRTLAPVLIIIVVELAWLFVARMSWEAATPSPGDGAFAGGKRRGTFGRTMFSSLVLRLLSVFFGQRPVTAIAWKNVTTAIRTQPIAGQLALVIGIPVLLGITSIPGLRSLTVFACGMAAMWATLLVIAGPHFVRNDLRLDLAQLRLLRTYPLDSLEICTVEVGSSTFVLTMLQLVMITLSFVALLGNPVVPLSIGWRFIVVLAAFLVLPFTNAINVALHNVFALLFPRWSHLGVKRFGRADGIGQFYIAILTSVGMFVVALLLPVSLGVVLMTTLRPMGTVASIIGGSGMALALTLAEVVAVVWWMARLLNQADMVAIAEGVTA